MLNKKTRAMLEWHFYNHKTDLKLRDNCGKEVWRDWAEVVKNTYVRFFFEPEYDIMVALYIKRQRRQQITVDGLWERTLFRWRDNWLEYALKWAKEFNLL